MVQYLVEGDGTYKEEYMESPIPKNTIAVSVMLDGERYKIVKTYDILAEIWSDVTSQEEMESQTIARNKRHPQQTTREEGVATGPLMNEIQANHGLNPRVDDLLAGKFETEHEVSEETAAWIETVKQTEKEKTTHKVVGLVMKEQFQYAFKIANKKTLPLSSGIHYTTISRET